MDDTDLRLDGNAAGGLMGEIFTHDMTSAHAACASCGNVAMIGASPLYMAHSAPGAVVRCARCGQVLMVFVDRGKGWRLGTPGLRWIEVG